MIQFLVKHLTYGILEIVNIGKCVQVTGLRNICHNLKWTNHEKLLNTTSVNYAHSFVKGNSHVLTLHIRIIKLTYLQMAPSDREISTQNNNDHSE